MSRIKNKQIEISTDFDINSNKLTNVADPVNDTDAANKQFVEDTIAGSSGVIGEAEDGDYTDGLFKDLTSDTEIGVPIDRFNEVLGALAPPPSPNLSDSSGTLGGDVTGNLSFDSTYTITGYANADVSQGGTVPGISRDGLWSISGKRLGIISATANNDITGILNYQVPADTGTPNPSYPADSFGDGDKGSLNLYVNGVLVDTIDIESSLTAIDSTNGNTTSGFVVSAASAIKFPSGTLLDLFKYRTGTYRVVADDVNIQNGYNWIIVEQDLGTVQRTLTRFEFIVDDATDVTTFSGNSLSALSMTGSKFLSGVEYNTGGTATYSITISNVYKNTYSDSNTAISFTEGNGSIPSQAIPILDAALDNNVDLTLTPTFTISSNIRLINDQISAQTSVLRTVQATQTSAVNTIINILMDDINSSSTLLFDDFNAESYRLRSDDNYDTYGAISTNSWDSTVSIVDTGDLSYNDGLQTIGGVLVYPGNTSYPTDFGSITNGPAGNPDYSTLTGERTYYRYFRQTSPTTANFVMNIQGSGGTFVSNGTALSGNNIHVFLKAPGLAAEETGWLDAYDDFATGQWVDNDGMRNSGAGSGRAFNTNWGLTIGTKNTSNTSGYMVVKIVVGSAFSGSISGITLAYS